MSGRMWEAVETEVRKIGMTKAKGRRKKREDRAEEKEKKKTKEGENDRSKKKWQKNRRFEIKKK